MNKAYAIYLAVVAILLSFVAFLGFGFTPADLGTVIAGLFGGLYEARWALFGAATFMASGLGGAFLFTTLFQDASPSLGFFSTLFGAAFGIVSFFIGAANIPLFAMDLPANWPSNLLMVGLFWAYIGFAILGRRLLRAGSTSAQNTPVNES